MAVSKVDFGGRTLMDLTGDSVTEDALVTGYTAHDAAGNAVDGANPYEKAATDAEVLTQEQLLDEIVEELAKRCVVTEPLLQARTVTPTEEVQVVTPDAGYDGLSSVTVEAAQGGEGKYGWSKNEFLGNFSQPVLSADGTLGGSVFAVSASNITNGYELWHAFGSSESLVYSSSVNPSVTPVTLKFYNPVPIQLNTLSFKNVPSAFTSSSPKTFIIKGSNDNSNWTTLGTFTNNNNTNSATWSVTVNSQKAYKYYAMEITSANTSNAYTNIGKITINAKALQAVGYVVSDDVNAYPDGNLQDGYYYKKL